MSPMEHVDEGMPDTSSAAIDVDSFSKMSTLDTEIISRALRGVDVAEIYSPERVTKLCARFGLVKGTSMDLATGWDSDRAEDRRRAWARLKLEQPHLVVGSPPCTMFSSL